MARSRECLSLRYPPARGTKYGYGALFVAVRIPENSRDSSGIRDSHRRSKLSQDVAALEFSQNSANYRVRFSTTPHIHRIPIYIHLILNFAEKIVAKLSEIRTFT